MSTTFTASHTSTCRLSSIPEVRFLVFCPTSFEHLTEYFVLSVHGALASKWISTKLKVFKNDLLRHVYWEWHYTERLSRLGLQTLESRRVISDVAACYKLLNDKLDIDCYSFFSLSHNTNMRGNGKKTSVMPYYKYSRCKSAPLSCR